MDLRRVDHVSDNFKQISVFKFNNKIIILLYFENAILLFGLHFCLIERFVLSSNVNSKDIRTESSLLFIPKHTTVMFNRKFTVTTFKLWISLLNNIQIMKVRT